MNSRKIFVIGSNSFSGSNFVAKALQLGCEVLGVSRSPEPLEVFLPYKWSKKDLDVNRENFKFKKLNLNKDLSQIIKCLDEFKPEFVVNFAAQGMVAESWLNPTHWYKTNVVSQVALHDELRKKDFIKKYVHITTPEVYGSTDEGWINEQKVFSPSTPYAVSRAACDMHLKSFFEAYRFPVVFTRAANVFGPGQQLYRIIPRTILSALSGKIMNLHGGGSSIRSFIHISDVVDATMNLAIKAEPGSSWHLSTREYISIKSLVEKICHLCNVEFEKIVKVTDERLGKDQSYLLDSSAIRENLNWKEKISLDAGIKDTISWVEDNYDLLYKLPWNYIHKL